MPSRPLISGQLPTALPANSTRSARVVLAGLLALAATASGRMTAQPIVEDSLARWSVPMPHSHGVPRVALLDTTRVATGAAHSGALLIVDKTQGWRQLPGASSSLPRHMSWLARCLPGEFWLLDEFSARVLRFRLDGSYVGELHVNRGRPSIFPQVVSCTARGEWVHLRSLSTSVIDPLSSGFRLPVEVVLSDTSRLSGRVLLATQSTEMVHLGGGASPRPSGFRLLAALGRRYLALSSSDSSDILAVDLKTGGVRELLLPANWTRPEDRGVDRERVQLARNAPADQTSRFLQALRNVPSPRHPRRLDSILMDECDRVWAFGAESGQAERTLVWVWAPGEGESRQGHVNGALAVHDVFRNRIAATWSSATTDSLVVIAVRPDALPRCGMDGSER